MITRLSTGTKLLRGFVFAALITQNSSTFGPVILMEAILSWLKLPKNLAWPLTIVSGLLLWGPADFKEGLGLQPFIDTYRDWIGIVFLFFLILGLQFIVSFLYEITIDAFRERKRKEEADKLAVAAREEAERQARAREEKAVQDISSLTGVEKVILRHFLVNDTRTQDLDYQNGNVSNLTSLGFIYRASSVSYGGLRGSFTFPYNISDWAWNYIHEHPEVLE